MGVSGYPSAHGFTIAFAACAVALALGVVVGLAIPQRRPADAFAPHEAGEVSTREPAAGDVSRGEPASGDVSLGERAVGTVSPGEPGRSPSREGLRRDTLRSR